MTLKDYLIANLQLTDDELAIIGQSFKSVIKAKGTILLELGRLSTKVYFIESGLARSSYIQNNREITQAFFMENGFIMSIHGVFHGQPSPYCITLLEDSMIRSIEYKDLESLFERYPAGEKLMRLTLIGVIKLMEERLNNLHFTSAQERYNYLLEYYPTLLLRAPLGHIASYLGITQQTLSVIRAKLSK